MFFLIFFVHACVYLYLSGPPGLSKFQSWSSQHNNNNITDINNLISPFTLYSIKQVD